MKIEAKKSVIEIQDDDDNDDFLSQVAAAEAHALSNKRRKITSSQNAAVPNSRANHIHAKDDFVVGGLYTAALKGDKSLNLQSSISHPLRGRVKVVATENDNVVAGDHRSDGGDSCFKCGKVGHWARDCDATGGGGGGGGQFGNYGSDPSIPEKTCPCGSGTCLVLTANTERNRGRKFYKCPIRQENGGCGFFEWVDSASSGTNVMTGSGTQNNYASDSSYPDLQCPCGAGFCLILTAKTGKNVGQQFYRCPLSQGSSCNFFKWCNEPTLSAGLPVSASKVHYNASDANNKSYSVRTGSSCFKCGKEGHWAKDCSITSTNSSTGYGGRSVSSGTCSKCGKPGHWARDCSFC